MQHFNANHIISTCFFPTYLRPSTVLPCLSGVDDFYRLTVNGASKIFDLYGMKLAIVIMSCALFSSDFSIAVNIKSFQHQNHSIASTLFPILGILSAFWWLQPWCSYLLNDSFTLHLVTVLWLMVITWKAMKTIETKQKPTCFICAVICSLLITIAK